MPLKCVVNGRRLRLCGRIFGHSLVDLAQPVKKSINLGGHNRELFTAATLASLRGQKKRLFVAGGGRGRRSAAAEAGADLGERDQLQVDLVFQLTGL